MAGDLSYFFIPVADRRRAGVFFSALLGWELTERPGGDGYQIDNTDPLGGIVEGREGNRPHVYFQVDDLDHAVERITQLGGSASEIDRFEEGASAECTDDQGTVFGLFQPAS